MWSLRLILVALTIAIVVLGSAVSVVYLQQSSEDAALRNEITSLQDQVSSLQQQIALLENFLANSSLKLVVTINATSIQSGQAVDVEALVNNTSGFSLNATADFDNYTNFIDWNRHSIGGCGSVQVLPIYMGVFRGHYDAFDFNSSMSPLQTVSYSFGTCPYLGKIVFLVFKPYSDVATFYADTGNSLYGNFGDDQVAAALQNQQCNKNFVGGVCGGTPGVSGCWTEEITAGNVTHTFHSFEPGSYTVVVGDFWGHTQFLYFQVS